MTVNGRTISIQGHRIVVDGILYGPTDGTAPADGESQTTLALDRDGRIVGDVKGNLTVLVTGGGITLVVEGNVDGSVTCDGDVQCSRVGGSVTARRNVTCDSVGGSANAGGDIQATRIGGSVNAGRDVVRGPAR